MQKTGAFRFDPSLVKQKLGEGVTAKVFAYGENGIVKIFHPDFDEAFVRKEVAGGLAAWRAGLPVPEMYGFCRDGDHFVLAQERIVGESLLKVMLTPGADVDGLLDVCVKLLVRIHACHVHHEGLPEQKTVFAQGIAMAPELSAQEKEALLALLHSLPDGDSLCHMDFHFDNIILRDGSPVVIDWCDAMCGDPAADVARSQLLSRQTALPDFLPPQAIEVVRHVSDTVLTHYPDAYRACGGRLENLDAWTAVVAAVRLQNENPANKTMLLNVIRDYLAADRR